MLRHGLLRLLPFLCLITLGACATNVQMPTEAPAHVGFQRSALTPENGGKLVEAPELQAGDILLSAADALTSAGIRLMTMAPVSHAALYLGEGVVAEAVGSGVRTRTLQALIEEESVVVAFRHPGVTPAHGERMRSFSAAQIGHQYNYLGVVLQAPFAIERRACEIPGVPTLVRDACLKGIATIQLGSYDNDRFFCSQFVLEAYRDAGVPIIDVRADWISPADILHMREGDVPSMVVSQPLTYVGHLKFPTGTLTLNTLGSALGNSSAK
ncbi:hypothetical protein [Niveibacterium sp. SC-1]|uniref:hypothetical protein n=1 Tax=Niveibacterium sp. SC-1 TaxID=3135646 RepID=UPI00311DBA4D